MKTIKGNLKRLKSALLSLRKEQTLPPVDADWYRENHPDVAAVGMDPAQHYFRFGRFEGRLPMPPAAMLRHPAYQDSLPALTFKLWRGYSRQALPCLLALAQDPLEDRTTKGLAYQAIADWQFCAGDIKAARDSLLEGIEIHDKPSGAMVSGLFRCYQLLNQNTAATQLIERYSDVLREVDAPFLNGRLAALFQQHGLSALPDVDDFHSLAVFSEGEIVRSGSRGVDGQPLISVIVPVYNAGTGLTVAVHSLRAQTYQNLEIILVNDASTDNSYQLMQDLAALDGRIRLVSCEKNQGAYGARNLGMTLAQGEFVTVHDSDDWSHPEKIALQWQALKENSSAMYSISFWVRVLPDMRFLGSWMLSSPFLQLNHSSALFRREVLERCGLWDYVRVGGDTEYIRRVQTVFGAGINVLPDVPLSLSLVHPQSLTQTKATHVSTIFFGLRRLYREAMQWRHRSLQIESKQPKKRLVPAPLGNLPYPVVEFSTLLVADFSQWDTQLEALLKRFDDLVLLHWARDSSACADEICDEVWAHCQAWGNVFLHPGAQVQVNQIVLQAGDLILNRPDYLPTVKLCEPGDSDVSSGGVSILEPATQGYVSDSMVRSLFACGGDLAGLAELFDADFYLNQNPDVADAVAHAKVTPLPHFIRYGQHEGRQGFNHQALELEAQLWQGKAQVNDLLQLVQGQVDTQQIESAHASWALARWYASHGEWFKTLDMIECHFKNPAQLITPGHRGPWLLWFTAHLNLANGDIEKLSALRHQVQLAMQQQGLATDLLLASASLASALKKPALQQQYLKALWRETDFNNLMLSDGSSEQGYSSNMEFDDLPELLPQTLVKQSRALKAPPLVSVIVPCHNAQASLPTALKSLLAQSWPSLEVIVVDDASSDSSVEIAKSFIPLFKARGNKLQVVRQSLNQGAYAARNRGLEMARGVFITTHDADDWSHPQKIARQAEALVKDKFRAASLSHWVRSSECLQFSYWRPESSWVHPNMSSLMFRRDVFEKLGFWDRVSVSADTEYYYRILTAYGYASVVEVFAGTPLAFGRHNDASLTQKSQTHIRTQYVGLRYDYMTSAHAWHKQSASLYMPAEPAERLFTAPKIMQRPSPQKVADEIYDENWYLSQYPDVQAANVDGRTHFIRWGLAEGRIGGPKVASHQQSMYDGIVWHEDAQGQRAATVLVFAHQVTAHQFGAERSLLDVVASMQAQQRNVVVVIPTDIVSYTTKLRGIAQKVHVQPYTWWHAKRSEAPAVVDACEALVKAYQPTVVYVNTLTLWEPLLAARNCAVQCWVHVRELADGDDGLCQQLGTDAEGVRSHALAYADGLIANSHAVAEFLNAPEKTVVIPNQLCLKDFLEVESIKQPNDTRPLKVGMLSSNIAKKGLADVIQVATKTLSLGLPIEYHLFGPDNAYVNKLKRTSLPENLQFEGYTENPLNAFSTLDVVLNLSHFKESFGRTVLEAMAAGRVVVCYDWGALSELVIEGTGFKVPFAETEAVSKVLAQLAKDRMLLLDTADKARTHAQQYDAQHVRKLWLAWLQSVEQV